MLREPSGEKMAEHIHNFPSEDPIQLYGLSVNEQHTYSYRKSKGMMSLTLRCEDAMNDKESLIFESLDIEEKLVTHQIETVVSETLKKYAISLSQRVINGHEKHIKVLAYSNYILLLLND